MDTDRHDVRQSHRQRVRTLLPAAALLAAPLLTVVVGVAPASAAVPPRPGCGFGDDNHAHQAAPGRDPLGLRPGAGNGDANHPHTAPPGQAPAGAGDQSSPRRGCTAAPLP